jgi:hypothetical protein
MKKILTYIMIGSLAMGVTSCKKTLDINDNPNNPTSATPELVLPQSLVGTGAMVSTYNNGLTYPGGFFANVYGFGGYGATVTINYSSANFAALWTSAYDVAEDYQYVIDNTSSDPALANSNSIARIMKSFVFSKLVDQYNDVPYFEALKGAEFLTPKYDKGADIYKDLVAQLNLAIDQIEAAETATDIASISGEADPMFAGDMVKWKRFANSLKLRLLIKMAPVPELSSFATAEFAAFDNTLGVIQDDALVNPGYVKQAGRLNPTYNLLAADENNNRRVTSSLPTDWIYSFYDGTKLEDEGRGEVVFRNFPATATNQLGQENLASSVIPPAGSTAWYTGADFNTPGLGAVKGPSQGQVIMLLTEAKLLQAEAIVRGYIQGDAGAAFDAGVTASFRYLYKDQAGTVNGDVPALVQAYKTANAGRYLADWAATSIPVTGDYNLDVLQRRIEAIITQKYIAMNVINCDEAFAEFRRTGYPRIVNGSANPTLTFASLQSTSTSPDKLITRLPYPQAEYNLNQNNVPQNVNIFTQKIFWDLN